MDVSEILKLLATLSIGLDDPTDSDVVVFMQYINLCYFEIIQETISQNPLCVIKKEVLDCTDGKVDSTSSPIFIPKVIYDSASNIALSGTTFDEVIENDPGITQKGNPTQWYYSGGFINVYPYIAGLKAQSIGIQYIAQPPKLQSSTKSEDILIPPLFQQILADGASYYLFQSESGFKDQMKMQASIARWETGKQKLFAYMKNIAGRKHLSTYSSI